MSTLVDKLECQKFLTNWNVTQWDTDRNVSHGETNKNVSNWRQTGMSNNVRQILSKLESAIRIAQSKVADAGNNCLTPPARVLPTSSTVHSVAASYLSRLDHGASVHPLQHVAALLRSCRLSPGDVLSVALELDDRQSVLRAKVALLQSLRPLLVFAAYQPFRVKRPSEAFLTADRVSFRCCIP